jgi:hypothetical protein
VATARKTLAAGTQEILPYNCPKRAPFLVNWDSEQSEHIQVAAVRGKQVATATGTVINTCSVAGQLVLGVDNVSSASGYVTVFLGCSNTSPGFVPTRHHRSGKRYFEVAGKLGCFANARSRCFLVFGSLLGALLIGQTSMALADPCRVNPNDMNEVAPFSWTVCGLAGYGSVRAASLSAS